MIHRSWGGPAVPRPASRVSRVHTPAAGTPRRPSSRPGGPSSWCRSSPRAAGWPGSGGNGRGEAEVVEHTTERIERTIKGTKQSRNGTEDNPAYVLEQSTGQTVLKLHSELERA